LIGSKVSPNKKTVQQWTALVVLAYVP